MLTCALSRIRRKLYNAFCIFQKKPAFSLVFTTLPKEDISPDFNVSFTFALRCFLPAIPQHSQITVNTINGKKGSEIVKSGEKRHIFDT